MMDLVEVTEPPGIRRRTQSSPLRLPWDGVLEKANFKRPTNPVSRAKTSFHNEDSV